MKTVIRLADHTIISIIISVQFLYCAIWVFGAFTTLAGAVFSSVAGIAYLTAGFVTASMLQKRGWWRRVAAMLWSSLNLIFHGRVNWQHPDNFFDYFAIYSAFAVAYLAATAIIEFAVGLATDLPEGKKRLPEENRP